MNTEKEVRCCGALRCVLFTLLALAVSNTAAHAQACWLGMMNSGAGVTVDGVVGAGEWGDGSTLLSGSSCLDRFRDWNGTSFEPATDIPTLVNRNLRVRSKRVGADLFFLFEVEDHTRLLNGSTALTIGEMIILHIDPNFSRTPGQLENGGTAITRDYRIEIIYKRDVNPPTVNFSASTATMLCSGMTRNIFTAPVPNPAITAAATNTATSYIIEVRIPVAQIGSPALTGNLGIAYAVVNDLGRQSGEGDNYATGSAFPAGMALTDATYGVLLDPANPTSFCNEWISPSLWGGAFFTSAPATVTISRMPVFWNSEDILPRACTEPSYTYYSAGPCRLRLDATLRNTGTTSTRRNVLYVFGNRDAASVRWTAADLRSIDVPAGNSVQASAEFRPPSGLAEHPCVRVLILPTSFHATFDSTRLRNLNNATDAVWDSIMLVYGLNDAHWAQKNISRSTSVTQTCPIGGCAALWDDRLLQLAQATGAFFASAIPPLVARAHAQQRDTVRRPMLPGRDFEEYGETDIVVQVETFGVATTSAYRRRRIAFIEPLGGAIQLIPAIQGLRAEKGTRTTFNITNPNDYPRLVFAQVVTSRPASLAPTELQFNMEIKPQELRPGASLQADATVGDPPGGGIRIPGGCGDGGNAAIGFGVIFVTLALRRARKRD